MLIPLTWKKQLTWLHDTLPILESTATKGATILSTMVNTGKDSKGTATDTHQGSYKSREKMRRVVETKIREPYNYHLQSSPRTLIPRRLVVPSK